MREHGYELNLSDSRTYTRYRFFRGHYDFATSVGFTIDRVRTLPQGLSDHLPILGDRDRPGSRGGQGGLTADTRPRQRPHRWA